MGNRRLAIVSTSLGFLMLCSAAAAESFSATSSSGETAAASISAGSQHSRRLHNSPLAMQSLTARVRRVPYPTSYSVSL